MAQKILTADDSASIRQMVGFSLKGTGYDVAQASDGMAALEILKDEQVAMLITDLDMPGMDGIELSRRARSLPGYGKIPIVILSTESDPDVKDRARRAGVTGWITKPFKPRQITDVVTRLLPRARGANEARRQ